MTDSETEIIGRESRAARRLGRLFRIERAGGFDRRSVATVRRLIERRGMLVSELLLIDGLRRTLNPPRSAELEQALAELAREVNRSLHHSQNQVARLHTDLRLRRGEGMPTGVRDGASGLLLGRG
jgi:hypothetical protein